MSSDVTAFKNWLKNYRLIIRFKRLLAIQDDFLMWVGDLDVGASTTTMASSANMFWWIRCLQDTSTRCEQFHLAIATINSSKWICCVDGLHSLFDITRNHTNLTAAIFYNFSSLFWQTTICVFFCPIVGILLIKVERNGENWLTNIFAFFKINYANSFASVLKWMLFCFEWRYLELAEY